MTTSLTGGGTSNLDALSVAGAAAVGSLSVGGNALDATFQQVINNTGASSDVSLAIGQLAYVDVSAATTAALKIATGDNQEYEITLAMQGNNGTTGNTLLNPNNTTLTNMFIYGVATVGSSASGYLNALLLSYGCDLRRCVARVSTKTISKGVVSQAGGNAAGSVYGTNSFCSWVAVASTITGDTTTAWTSLGTVTFPVAATGRIYIRRLA
jgi:hypothetical protein